MYCCMQARLGNVLLLLQSSGHRGPGKAKPDKPDMVQVSRWSSRCSVAPRPPTEHGRVYDSLQGPAMPHFVTQHYQRTGAELTVKYPFGCC